MNYEEGENCPAFCSGVLQYERDGSCSCHINPPCYSCMNSYLACQKCGLDARDYKKPIRIQRQRTKGWRMPENTVYVGRPTKWGNPYPVVRAYKNKRGESWWVLKQCLLGGEGSPVFWGVDDVKNMCETALEARIRAVEMFRELIEQNIIKNFSIERIRNELRGKNLACFCPLDHPCHADVLLEMANG